MEIIDFNKFKVGKKSYKEHIKETIELLERTGEQLGEICINLAVCGKWKEWNNSIPEGATFNFTEKMLFETGDENVNILMNLKHNIANALESIQNRA